MSGKVKLLSGIILLLVVLLMGVSCSSAKAECKVTLSRKGELDVIINPPGETGPSDQDGWWTQEVGGDTIWGDFKKQYTESGNKYLIKVTVSVEDKKLSAYEISVTGGVYGITPHICEYP